WHFDNLQGIKLEKWAKSEIEKRGSKIEKETLEKLMSYVSNDIWQLDQEIEKLTLYKKNKTIEKKDIDEIVTANIQVNIFNLIDNIGIKNKKNAILELNKLLEKGEEPLYILKMLIYQIKNMLLIKDLIKNNFGKKEIIQITKKHPFVIEKTINQIKNFTLNELISIYDKIFDLEIDIKRGKQKPQNALVFFIEKLC
ncbi:MAG: DNA polymerase III subunit delta, partial [Candidatus Woesearchaeota archaeon]